LIEPGLLEKIKKTVHDLGFTLMAAPMEFHDGKIKIHRVSKIDSVTGETFVLDMLIVTPEIEDAWNNKLTVEWEHGNISVVSPEGLILLKSFRRSGQDQDDIDYLRSLFD
jgi:hypothetical protein